MITIVAQGGGEAEYTTFLERFRAPATPQEQIRYLYALAEFPSRPLVQRTLDLAVTEVRTQNAPFVINVALGNRVAGDLAWDFVTSRWDELAERFPHKMLDRMVSNVMFLTDRAADVHAFFADHPIPTGQKQLEQTLERLDIHAAFAQREAGNIAERSALRTRSAAARCALGRGPGVGGEGVEAPGLLVERGGFLDADVARRHAVGERLQLRDEFLEGALAVSHLRSPRLGRRSDHPPARSTPRRPRRRRPAPARPPVVPPHDGVAPLEHARRRQRLHLPVRPVQPGQRRRHEAGRVDQA